MNNWIKLQHGWLYREGDKVKYQAPNGMKCVAETAFLHNVEQQNVIYKTIAMMDMAIAKEKQS